MVAAIHLQNDQLVVSGELDFQNVQKLFAQSLLLLCEQTECVFDLSGIHNSDSAGLALLVEWLKYGKQHGKQVRFLGIPKQLSVLIKVSGLNESLV